MNNLNDNYRFDDEQLGYGGYESREPEPSYYSNGYSHSYGSSPSDWFESLRNLWQWDELAAEISQENQARIALVGLPGAGKSALFDHLRGWQPEDAANTAIQLQQISLEDGLQLESYGLFILADFPKAQTDELFSYDAVPLALGDPALLIYLIDATAGVQAEDYRWIATIRASGRPLIVALNKIDLIEETAVQQNDIEQQIGMAVIPISAQTGQHVQEKLLPALLDTAPKLAVPLGRELHALRRLAAQRVTRQAAILAGMMGAQPVPILDLPMQAMLQVGVVLRIGATYGHTPTGKLNREVISTIISVFGLRYLALSLVKLIPLLGWVVSGLASGAATMLIGETAVRYYEAGATIPLRQLLNRERIPLPRRKRENSIPLERSPVQEITIQQEDGDADTAER